VSLKFYVDEHVPRAVTIGLRLRGVDVMTIQEDARRGLPDPAVLDRATELGRLLVTRDEDFIRGRKLGNNRVAPFAVSCMLIR
jgi:predicted nuclease of predicted toxin-antitoxin system